MRRPALFMTAAVAASASSIGARGDGTDFDQMRYEAASARAALHWATGGYDTLPGAFDLDAIARDKDRSIVARLADELVHRNQANGAAVVSYINKAVLPFVASHRTQFECYLAENYYNMAIPTDQLASFDESPLSRYFDASYLLLGTEKARRDAEVALPDDDSLLSAMTYIRENGWTNPSNKTHFNCVA